MKTIFVSILSIVSIQVLGAGARDLNRISCSHWQNPNDDSKLSITFRAQQNDFVRVLIRERFTSIFTHDTLYPVVSNTSEQVQIGNKQFSLGVDDLVVVIDRTPNAKGDLGGVLERRDIDQKFPLVCKQN